MEKDESKKIRRQHDWKWAEVAILAGVLAVGILWLAKYQIQPKKPRQRPSRNLILSGAAVGIISIPLPF